MSHLLPTYARVDLAFERGEGAWLTATDGSRYLDFAGGVAVNVLGHAHPALIAALSVVAGLALSLYSDAPGGPSIVLAMTACATASLLAVGRGPG